MLPKKYRLSAKEFDKVYKQGTKYRGLYGMLVVSKNNIDNPRFGYVVSKKIGNAVKRHRMTRLLRNISMEIVKEKEVGGLDFQYIAFQFCDEYSVLKDDMLKTFNKISND